MTEAVGSTAGSAVGTAAGIARHEARIMARVTEDVRVKGRTPAEALANIGDAVRYTYEYPADTYTDSVRADIERLWREGYIELAVRNCWACDTWKGISTSWEEPGTRQVFEVQFHTPHSLAARELTYPAYQRLRDPATADAERAAIMASLRDVYAADPASHAPPAEKARAERTLALLHQAERTPAPSPSYRPPPAERPAERITYYSISDRYCSEDSPAGVLRRIEHGRVAGPGGAGTADYAGQRDEAFGWDLRWRHTFLLYSWERGNLDNSLREISADQALAITDQIRREVAQDAIARH